MSKEKQYTVKITGSGTFKEIRQSLECVIDQLHFIKESDAGEPVSDVQWEDGTLMTEITEK